MIIILTLKDIDECYTGAHMCDDTAQCLNAPGTYNCACNEGYSGNGYSCVLDDVDEERLEIHQKYLRTKIDIFKKFSQKVVRDKRETLFLQMCFEPIKVLYGNA